MHPMGANIAVRCISATKNGTTPFLLSADT